MRLESKRGTKKEYGSIDKEEFSWDEWSWGLCFKDGQNVKKTRIIEYSLQKAHRR